MRDYDWTNDRTANNKFRKRELERAGDISCGYCRYHKGENASRLPRRRSWKDARVARKQWA